MKSAYRTLAGILVLGLFVAGCGDSDEDSSSSGDSTSVVGTWTWARLTATGPGVPGGSMVIDPGLVASYGYGTVSASITFNDDNTFNVNGSLDGQPMSSSGTWSTFGNQLTITISDPAISRAVTYAVSGNTLSITITGAQITDAVEGAGYQVPAEYSAILSGLSVKIDFTK